MRIERVTALDFGPFEGESLDLAPGLTVVSGPNESGKSTWHAAMRAATCGVRRGRGANTKADAAFEDRHRPWDGDGRWGVEVRLALDDGRTVEISQDLAGKVACRATDIVLGRDVSDEIMDGTPDASRWLGLDRDAFGATICVGQAQLAAIAGRDTAASLQEHMQRAAATRGTDATAAEARGRLDEFRRQQVGVDRQNARGPLRSARMRLEAVRAALDDARQRHDAFLEASAGVEAAERVALTISRRVATVEAALARQSADELAARVARAVALAARHPSEPAGAASRDARSDAVAAALDAWRGRPRLEPLSGSTAAELEGELATLPAAPVGDLDVHPTVASARRALDRAEDAVGLLGAAPEAPLLGSGGPDEQVLRGLARRLRTPDPEPSRRWRMSCATRSRRARLDLPWLDGVSPRRPPWPRPPPLPSDSRSSPPSSRCSPSRSPAGPGPAAAATRARADRPRPGGVGPVRCGPGPCPSRAGGRRRGGAGRWAAGRS